MAKTLFTDYNGFVEKFKPKKTTDDCYTPAPVYDAVLDWVRERVDLTGCNIVRPFYPQGDYEAQEYAPNDVVIDNPPFSILSKIIKFYNAKNVRYFLFAPALIMFNSAAPTKIVTDASIIYENGAVVRTGFVSNMFGDVGIMTAPALHGAIERVNKKPTQTLPKYRYPENVITVSKLHPLAAHGVEISIPRTAMHRIAKLTAQKVSGASIYGSGYLVSDKVAEEVKQAQAQARAQAQAQETIVWGLTEQERLVIQQLNNRQM